MTLCFLETPIEFGAPDGKPVDTMFTLITPTVRVHLHMLARLAMVLNEPSLRSLLRIRGKAEEIFREVRRFEDALVKPSERATKA